MTRALFIAAFLASCFGAPWPVTALLGVILIAAWRARISVLIGGALMDALYGIAVPALGGFAFIWTALFVLLIGVDQAVRARMMD